MALSTGSIKRRLPFRPLVAVVAAVAVLVAGAAIYIRPSRLPYPVAFVITAHSKDTPLSGLEYADVVYEWAPEHADWQPTFLTVFTRRPPVPIGPLGGLQPGSAYLAYPYGRLVVGNTWGWKEPEPPTWLQICWMRYDPVAIRDVLRQLSEQRWQVKVDGIELLFKRGTPAGNGTRRLSVSVTEGGGSGAVLASWRYGRGRYRRSIAGREYAVRNLVFLEPNQESDTFPEQPFVGGGRALYLVDGSQYEGSWEAKMWSMGFYTPDGTMRFAPGPIWIYLMTLSQEIASQ